MKIQYSEQNKNTLEGVSLHVRFV